jgi:hypothetical protein
MFVGLGQAEKGILFLLQERGVLCVADVLAAYPGVQPKSCRRAMRSLSSKGFGRLSETPVLTLASMTRNLPRQGKPSGLRDVVASLPIRENSRPAGEVTQRRRAKRVQPRFLAIKL